MEKKVKETLVKYVEILKSEGKGVVKLDRQTRGYLRKLRDKKTTVAATLPAAHPKVSITPVSQGSTKESTAGSSSEIAEVAELAGKNSLSKVERLNHLASRAAVCQKCAHLAKFRSKVVFGVGNPEAELMFVGEAPGADEDRLGEPFVGRAGDLLTKMIVAMGLSREQVYIANILKCRPDMPVGSPGNRKPTLEEMKTCSPYLFAQIEIIRPKVMVGLGATAVEGLLGAKGTISKLRGNFQEFRGIPFMPTFHPSYLLHNPTLETKRKVWEDLLQVMERLQMPINEKQRGFFLTK